MRRTTAIPIVAFIWMEKLILKSAKNKDLPFVVKANGIDVKAIGTAFNVSAYMEDLATNHNLVQWQGRRTTYVD